MSDIVEHIAPDGSGHGTPRMRVRDIDPVHAGYALALLRARWHHDEQTARLVLASVPLDEMTRSAIALASYLSHASFGPTDHGRRLALTKMAAVYHRKGRVRMARLCRDLSDLPSGSSPGHHEATFHVVDIMTVVALCAVIMAAIEADQGTTAAAQFIRYEADLAGAAHRRAG